MTIIRWRRGTAAEWTAANPTLAAGEPGLETDTNKYKIGNGSTPWNSLGYQATQGIQGSTGSTGAKGDKGDTGNTGPQGDPADISKLCAEIKRTSANEATPTATNWPSRTSYSGYAKANYTGKLPYPSDWLAGDTMDVVTG